MSFEKQIINEYDGTEKWHMLKLNSWYFLIEALIELKLGVIVGRGSSTCIKKNLQNEYLDAQEIQHYKHIR